MESPVPTETKKVSAVKDIEVTADATARGRLMLPLQSNY